MTFDDLLFDQPEREAPNEDVVALGRLTYGVTPEDLEKVKKTGIQAFIQEQLNPTDIPEAEVQSRLSMLMLPIKYEASMDKYAAVDEIRPLKYLDAGIETLWPLADNKNPIAYQERVRPTEELRMASWIKAVYSKWQVREIMVEFWHNHFNVNAFSEQRIAAVFPIYDKDVIRKNCFGNFRTFLEDVAKSTAMQFYLDNFSSKASPANENYARELFELHTLGSDHYYNSLYNRWREVPGAMKGEPIGYIDEDVYEAARSFTGWTIADGSGTSKGENLPNTGKFYYYDGWHDNYQKRVLGNEFQPNQPPMADGLKVLDLVANHPATAQHVCGKLVRRFVADDAPESLIKSATSVWIANRKKPDQIKITLTHILSSKPFLQSWGKKIKRPFELMTSLIRATGAEFTPQSNLNGQLSQMGYFHYQWPTPTGHPDKSEYWLSSNTMLARWNNAINLMVNEQNKITTFNFKYSEPESPNADQLAAFWTRRLLQKNMPPEFMTMLSKYVSGGRKATDPIPANELERRSRNLIALIALTPDFQLK